MSTPKPERESERLRALDQYRVLDTPPEEAFDRITRLASRAIGAPIALVSLVDEARQWFKSRVGLDAEETPREVAFCAHAICGDDVMVVPDAAGDPRFSGNPLVVDDPKIRFYAGVPLRTRNGHNLGTLCVIDRRPRELDAEETAILRDLASLVMDELELRLAGKQAVQDLWKQHRVSDELHLLATTDSLTGALNRRHFLETGEQEILRAKRYGRPLSVLMLDVDQFKGINDAFGHATGDAALQALVERTRNSMRAQDFLGRIGGEEFAMLLPETAGEAAQLLAERVRQALSEITIETGNDTVRFTASLGVVECRPDRETIADALRRADDALYSAKRSGRNCVRLGRAA